MSNIKALTCACCGTRTRGRQWWNRDTGFGLCPDCIPYVSERTSPEEVRENYGENGKHYNIQEKSVLQRIKKLDNDIKTLRQELK